MVPCMVQHWPSKLFTQSTQTATNSDTFAFFFFPALKGFSECSLQISWILFLLKHKPPQLPPHILHMFRHSLRILSMRSYGQRSLNQKPQWNKSKPSKAAWKWKLTRCHCLWLIPVRYTGVVFYTEPHIWLCFVIMVEIWRVRSTNNNLTFCTFVGNICK